MANFSLSWNTTLPILSSLAIGILLSFVYVSAWIPFVTTALAILFFNIHHLDKPIHALIIRIIIIALSATLALLLWGKKFAFLMMLLFILPSLRPVPLNSLDTFWPRCILAISLISYLVNPQFTLLSCRTLITLLVVLWGTRLLIYFALRKKGLPKQPAQQANITDNKLSYFFFSYIIYGIALIVIAYPVFLTNMYGCDPLFASLGMYNTFTPIWSLMTYPTARFYLTIIAVLLWIIGFVCESVSDWQLYQFLKNSAQGQVLTTGLWHYSRHPNYFGEILMWWALWLLSLTSKAGIFALAGIASPLLVMYMLRKVSGVPPVEQEFDNHPHYQQYKRTTSCIILWFRKS